MSTRLVILGFLRRQPLYGYEIKRMIEQIMGDWTNIAFGSIYFALKKLAEEGFVEKVGTEQEGSRPSRTVYQITAAGREEFLRLLRETWGGVERQYFRFDIALSFMEALPTKEIEGYLRNRINHLEHVIQFLGSHEEEELEDEHVPRRLAESVFGHHRVHFQAELDWTREVLENVEQGAFDAELDWMRGLSEEMKQRGDSS